MYTQNNFKKNHYQKLNNLKSDYNVTFLCNYYIKHAGLNKRYFNNFFLNLMIINIMNKITFNEKLK